MNKISIKVKRPTLLFIAMILFIAGLADIKYRGLFFRLLPRSAQSFLTSVIK
ncbi:hypothetical protein [Oceanobacillus bengalensis]|uniref:hypothetical protein n=1 Tax=Oceanobacillus bengalensis TaxID=1435466 RepID=UPI0016003DAF|nr:hypothetical protein [Oceanobacillus bengalensis]